MDNLPYSEIDQRADQLQEKLIAWRRDFHQHPELSNREVRTGKIVADHLRGLGLEVQSAVARTGVVALLRGGKPGPIVALRADMDALPVAEEVDLPFASKAKSEYEGNPVGVMHACGHDAHTAILMAVAEILAGMKAQIPGTIKFIFQPAEEGPPGDEEGGAELMIKEGVLENPRPAAIFGLHVIAGMPTGKIGYRPGATMASGDTIRIKVQGRQTHGAFPWQGIDPVVLAAQIVMGLQTIPSRQVDVTMEPSIVTISCIHGGVRENIIPDHVEMVGTMRTFNEAMREDIRNRIRTTAEHIAMSAGGSAQRAHRAWLRCHDQRSWIDRKNGADAAARRGRGQYVHCAQADRLGGFFQISASDSGLIFLSRHYTTEYETRCAKSFAAFLCGRSRVAARRASAGTFGD